MNMSFTLLADAAAGGSFIDYKLAFIICLVLGFVFLALAVAFFFIFNIPKVYSLKTGKGARKTIQRMQEMNAKTGRLTNKDRYTIAAQGNTAETAPIPQEVNPPAAEPATAVLTPQPPETEGTTLLNEGPSTTVLTVGGETTVLQGGVTAETAPSGYVRKTSGKFETTYRLILVSAEEIK